MKQRIDPARAAALYAELGSARAAARAMGRSASGVWRALKRAGVAVMGVGAVSADPRVAARRAATAHRWWCDDAARAARGAAIRTALADPTLWTNHSEYLSSPRFYQSLYLLVLLLSRRERQKSFHFYQP